VRWDPAQYGRYADERSRPFFDLVGRVDAAAPTTVVDLGCGPGNLTAQLPERWPSATVVGMDSSPDMIESARGYASAQVRFELGDVATWSPATLGPIDVLLANATLQWLPEHPSLLERFVGWLAPGGWFAFQVPGNFTAPSHAILAELRLSDRWRDRVGQGAERHLHVLDAADYADRLMTLGCQVDAWESTYIHVLQGEDPVVEWVRGTGLRPVLSALTAEEAEAFVAEYAVRLRVAYPRRADGSTLLAFRRIFVVAHRATPQ
jgi:trans-aconitate 2-methyltransferase